MHSGSMVSRIRPQPFEKVYRPANKFLEVTGCFECQHDSLKEKGQARVQTESESKIRKWKEWKANGESEGQIRKASVSRQVV